MRKDKRDGAFLHDLPRAGEAVIMMWLRRHAVPVALRLVLALLIDADLYALVLATHAVPALWIPVVVGGFLLSWGLSLIQRWQLVGVGMLLWFAIATIAMYTYFVPCNCMA